MRIAWISARDIGSDLAATTEIQLAKSLQSSGSEVTLLSPGVESEREFEHVEIKKINIPGLNSVSGARYVRRKLEHGGCLVENSDILLVDWRYVRSLRSFLKGLEIPWIIIDRGPPAFKGPLNRLQKIFWRDGWRFAADNAVGGMVVSRKHGDFVKRINNIEIELHVTPAGAERNPFLGMKSDVRDGLKIAYVGRIDERRGVRDLIRLSDYMDESGINHSIILAGEGDIDSEILVESSIRTSVDYIGLKSRKEVQKILANSHIGVMPMPKIPIWQISSPLKLAEYLASGLAIIGPKHTGNDLGLAGKWNKLGGSGDWVELAVEKITEILEDYENIRDSAIYQSESLQWASIATDVVDFINLVSINP